MESKIVNSPMEKSTEQLPGLFCSLVGGERAFGSAGSDTCAILLRTLLNHMKTLIHQLTSENQELKLTSFEELENQYYGPVGTPKRDAYEAELQLELLAETIKQIRKQRNLTQDELGKLLGVQKAQISKLESGATNVTFDTLLKVFKALKAKVTLKVELEEEPFLS